MYNDNQAIYSVNHWTSLRHMFELVMVFTSINATIATVHVRIKVLASITVFL